MISRRILAAVALLCAFSCSAEAQPYTKAQLNTQVGVNFPDNTAFQITPQNVRTISDNIVNSIMPTAPVVSGNLACFNGTTGLLQDCGVAPSNNIIIGTTPITGGSSTRVLFDNAGVAGEYTNTQLTALINLATSSLSGALPAWPNNTSTALLGNGTYGAINLATGVTGLLPNANLAQAGAATFKGNPTASTAGVQDFTIQGLTARGAPDAVNDKIPLFDNAAGTIKYVTPGAIAAAATAGVASINGTTGAFTTANGVISSGTVLQTDFTHNNVWTGSNIFKGNAFFGSGAPWVDVKSGANSCPAALGNNSTDDTSAIQCQINFMNTTYAGGFVFFPPGNYLVSGGGLTVTAGVILQGTGQNSTTINVNTNVSVMSFSISGGTCPSGGHLGGLRDISVFGFQGATPTAAAVNVGANCAVFFRDCKMEFGSSGLNNSGTDGTVENCFIWGFTNALLSNGANWYIRDKFDQPGATGATNAFIQGTYSGTGVAENHFEQCDFSGTYTNAVNINDGNGSTAITTFSGSVFSSPITITQAKATMFTGDEFGSTTITGTSGFLNIVGSFAFSATTATGAGARSCAGNANITC